MYRVLKMVILAMGITFAVLLTSCIQSLNQWEGSVDAVFRYRSNEGSTVVYEIKPDSYAEQAGLQPGDILITVDGKDVSSVSFYEVRNEIRGPVGTMALLAVKRGEAVLEIPVERRPVTK